MIFLGIRAVFVHLGSRAIHSRLLYKSDRKTFILDACWRVQDTSERSLEDIVHGHLRKRPCSLYCCVYTAYVSRCIAKTAKWHACTPSANRSTWASAQSGQSSLSAVWPVFTVRTQKHWVLSNPSSTQRRLIRLGGYPCWSDASLGTQSFCWFCHALAHMVKWFQISRPITFEPTSPVAQLLEHPEGCAFVPRPCRIEDFKKDTSYSFDWFIVDQHWESETDLSGVRIMWLGGMSRQVSGTWYFSEAAL